MPAAGQLPGGIVIPARKAETPRPSSGRLSLYVVVEGSDVLNARRAIVQSGDTHVEVMRCVPVPHSSQVRLIVELDEAALGDALLRITASLQKAELGRVVKVRPH